MTKKATEIINHVLKTMKSTAKTTSIRPSRDPTAAPAIAAV